jgi:RHS repeat-associated protein
MRGQVGHLLEGQYRMCNVNVITGELIRFEVDLFLPGYIPLQLFRMYKNTCTEAGWLGHGWVNSLAVCLQQHGKDLVYVDENGTLISLTPGPEAEHFTNADFGITVMRDKEQFVLTKEDGLQFFFPASFAWGVAPIFRARDVNGNTVRFEYEKNGTLRTITDTLGRRLFFEFDSATRFAEVFLVDDHGEWISQLKYTYDSANDLVAVTDALRRTVRYEYSDHLMTREIDYRGNSIYWQYDDSRRCIRTWRDGGILYRNLAFDDTRRTVRVTNSLGYSTVYRYDDKQNILSETNPLGEVRENIYDQNGNLVSGSDGGVIEELTFFDEAANCLLTATPAWGTLKYFFDSKNQLIRIQDSAENEWLTEYDDKGQVVKNVEPKGVVWTCEYAPRGYARRVTNPLGHSMFQQRSDDGRSIRLSDDLGDVVRCEYDWVGNLIAIEDAANRRTILENDAGDRCVRIKAPDGTSRRCEYDENDNITAIIDELGNATRFEYNVGDTIVRVVNAGGTTAEFHYDTEEQLVALTTWDGQKATFSYDPLGRPAQVQFFDGQIERYEYDEDSHCIAVSNGQQRMVSLEYEGNLIIKKLFPQGPVHSFSWERGYLASATDGTVSVARQFDERMRLIEEQQGDWAIRLGYDVMDNLVRIQDAAGRSISFAYDQRRRLTRVEDSHTGVHAFQYNEVDLLVEWRILNGCTTRFAHDVSERISEIMILDPAGQQLLVRSLTYDVLDRLVREVVHRREEPAAEITEYTYDPIDRLTRVVRNGQVAEWFEYDTNGNIIRSADYTVCQIGPGDRLLKAGAIEFDYDAAGRLVERRDTRGVTRFSYRPDGTLARIVAPDGVETTFDYDPTGRRVRKDHNSNETRMFWLDNTIFMEQTPSERLNYLFLPGLFFPMALAVNGDTYFFSFDQIGTPREAFTADGRLVWKKNTSVFGQPLGGADSSLFGRCGFMGQYRDQETGLDYNYYRYYDPAVGRYITQDPVGLAGGLSFYRYVTNPVNLVDPFGLFELTFGAAAWCHWNRSQKREFHKKVKAYKKAIEKKKKEDKKKGVESKGLVVRPCERDNKKASELWKQCGNKSPKQKSPKGGKGATADCTKDIDHIIDCQLGGPQKPPEVCDNLTPVNSSVNSSMGPNIDKQIKKALEGKTFAFLTGVKVELPKCPNRWVRTPACV